MRLLPNRPDVVPNREIVRLLKDRNSKGLQLLLREHAGRTRFQLRQEFGGRLDPSELDGVLNQAAFQAWSRVETFDPARGELGAWFFVIARNFARTVCKQEQRQPQAIDGLELAQMTSDPQVPALDLDDGVGAAPASSDRFAAGLRECIENLPPMQQRVVRADLQSGDVADAAELAAEFNTSTNSIYVSRSNARKALKKGLEAMGLFGTGDRRGEAAG